jgi:hypothetical protein
MQSRETGHARVYRALLRLYPAPFRTRFADEMVLLFSDQLRDALDERAAVGTLTTWTRTIGDLLVTATTEHLRNDRAVPGSFAVPPSNLTRLLGVLGVLGGAVILVAFLPFVPWSADLFNLRLVLFNLGTIAIVIAVYRRQVVVSPLLAASAAVPAVIANLWHLIMTVIAVSQPAELGVDGYGPVYIAASTAMWLSDAWFGLVALRLGGVGRVGALAVTIGSMFAFLGMANVLDFLGYSLAQVVGALAIPGIAVMGLGWVILGADLATRRRSFPSRQGDVDRAA